MFQDEIQSAHWKQDHVSLFTAAIWFDRKLHLKVIASDNLDHEKYTVVAYVDYLLDTLPATVKTISVWSDGPSSQFKNKFITEVITALQDKHQINIKWNYFTTSHGKGPVDGTGDSVRRQVWTAVSRRTSLATDATSFTATAKKVCNVDVVEMTSDEVDKRNAILNTEKVFQNASVVKGITSIHCNQVIGLVLHAHTTTKAAMETSIAQSSLESESLKVSRWCFLQYEDELFPGEIKAVVGDSYEVSKMVTLDEKTDLLMIVGRYLFYICMLANVTQTYKFTLQANVKQTR